MCVWRGRQEARGISLQSLGDKLPESKAIRKEHRQTLRRKGGLLDPAMLDTRARVPGHFSHTIPQTSCAQVNWAVSTQKTPYPPGTKFYAGSAPEQIESSDAR